MTNAIRCGLAAAVLALGFSLPSQSQAQLDVDVTIGVNDIIILYAYTDLTVDIPAASLESLLSLPGTCTGLECDEGTGSVSASDNGGTLEADFNLSSTLGGADLTQVPLTLQNVWAVRGISDGNINIVVSLENGTLSNGGSQIVINSATPSNTGFAAPGLGSEVVGDVDTEVDLSGVSTSGAHEPDTSPVYTIQATST